MHFPALILGCLLAVLLPILAVAPAPAQQRSAEPMPAILLHAARPAELERIALTPSEPRHARPQRHHVTDMSLTLLPGHGDLASAFRPQPPSSGMAGRRAVRAHLTLVSNGRLHRAPLAWCAGFRNGRAACEVECDGGRFTLRRDPDGSSYRLSLGATAGPEAMDEGSAIALAACGDAGRGGLLLISRHGGPAEVTLATD